MSEAPSDWMGRALQLESQTELLRKQVEILSRSNFDKVKEFHDRFSKNPDPTEPTDIAEEDKVLRVRLISEEYQELLKEMGFTTEFSITHIEDFPGVDLERVAKELADLLVVVYGTAARFGINIDEVFDAVHESNMSKLDKNGRPVYRDDGKVLKSDQYKEPDLKPLLKQKKSRNKQAS